MKEFTVAPFPDEKAGFAGFAPTEPCCICGKEEMGNLFVIRGECEHDDNLRIVLCTQCFIAMYISMGEYLHQSGDISVNADNVWELYWTKDGWKLEEMVVKEISMFGSYKEENGLGQVWNIHAVTKDRKRNIYRTFHEIGRTLFFNEESAKEAVRRKNIKESEG